MMTDRSSSNQTRFVQNTVAFHHQPQVVRGANPVLPNAPYTSHEFFFNAGVHPNVTPQGSMLMDRQQTSPEKLDQTKRRKIPIINPRTGREISPPTSPRQTRKAMQQGIPLPPPTSSPPNAIQKPFPVYIDRNRVASTHDANSNHQSASYSRPPQPPFTTQIQPQQKNYPIFLSNWFESNSFEDDDEGEEEVDKYEWTGLPTFGTGISLFEDDEDYFPSTTNL